MQLGRASYEPHITEEQYKDFQASWDRMCRLLVKLRSCWIADDPQVSDRANATPDVIAGVICCMSSDGQGSMDCGSTLGS